MTTDTTSAVTFYAVLCVTAAVCMVLSVATCICEPPIESQEVEPGRARPPPVQLAEIIVELPGGTFAIAESQPQ